MSDRTKQSFHDLVVEERNELNREIDALRDEVRRRDLALEDRQKEARELCADLAALRAELARERERANAADEEHYCARTDCRRKVPTLCDDHSNLLARAVEAEEARDRLRAEYAVAERFGWRPDAMGRAIKKLEADRDRLSARVGEMAALLRRVRDAWDAYEDAEPVDVVAIAEADAAFGRAIGGVVDDFRKLLDQTTALSGVDLMAAVRFDPSPTKRTVCQDCGLPVATEAEHLADELPFEGADEAMCWTSNCSGRPTAGQQGPAPAPGGSNTPGFVGTLGGYAVSLDVYQSGNWVLTVGGEIYSGSNADGGAPGNQPTTSDKAPASGGEAEKLADVTLARNIYRDLARNMRAQLAAVADALGTGEEGDGLVAVAAAAHDAEMRLAAHDRKQEIFDADPIPPADAALLATLPDSARSACVSDTGAAWHASDGGEKWLSGIVNGERVYTRSLGPWVRVGSSMPTGLGEAKAPVSECACSVHGQGDACAVRDGACTHDIAAIQRHAFEAAANEFCHRDVDPEDITEAWYAYTQSDEAVRARGGK